ncbi:MAG: tetratricopeptide repeat protein [Leptolyngbya sp. BL-A-14]
MKKTLLYLAIALTSVGLSADYVKSKLESGMLSAKVLPQPNASPQSAANKPVRNEPRIKGIPVSCYTTSIVNVGEHTFEHPVAWSDIAIAYIEAKQYDQAQEIIAQKIIAKILPDDSDGLTKISMKYAEQGQYNQALELAKSIVVGEYGKGGSNRETAITYLVDRLAHAKQYNRAFKTVKQIDDSSFRTMAMAHIAKAYAKAGQKQKAEALFSQALKAANSIEDENYQRPRLIAFPKSNALVSVAEDQAEAGQYEQALQIASIISNDYKRGLLEAIAISYASAGQVEQAHELLSQALQITKNSPESGRMGYPVRARALSNNANAYAKAGFHQEALQIANSIENSGERSLALMNLADVYIDSRENIRANEALLQATQVDGVMKPQEKTIYYLIDIASKYFKINQPRKANEMLVSALQFAKNIKASTESKSLEKAQILERIAREYASIGQYSKAIQIFTANTDLMDVGTSQKETVIGLLECAEAAQK